MTDDNKATLITSRCSESPGMKGSTKESCRKCKEEVWVSPETRKHILSLHKEEDVSYVCLHCHVEFLKEHPDLEYVPPSDGVMKEVMEQIGEEILEDFQDTVKH